MVTTRATRRAALAATVVLAATGAIVAVAPVATADQTLRLTTVKVADQSTELDLGAPGFSTGDTEIFVDEVQRRGEAVGSGAGSCTLALVSETRLVGLCATTILLPEGTLTTQGALDENPQQGPEGYRWAVTGGTGRYAGAAGEAIGTFRPDSDIVDVEIRLR